MRLFVIVAVSSVISACSDATASVDGPNVYRLLAVNGVQLPAAVPAPNGLPSAQLLSEEVRLGPDVLASAITRRRTSDGAVRTDTLQYLLRYVGRDTVRLQFTCPVNARCAPPDRLVMLSGGATLRMRVLTAGTATLDYVRIR